MSRTSGHATKTPGVSHAMQQQMNETTDYLATIAQKLDAVLRSHVETLVKPAIQELVE
jgi:hypothetical protein